MATTANQTKQNAKINNLFNCTETELKICCTSSELFPTHIPSTKIFQKFEFIFSKLTETL